MFAIYFYPLQSKIPPTTTKNSYSLIVEQYRNEKGITYRAYFGYGDSLRIGGKIDFDIYPRSKGIGSIIVNHLIDWGKRNYPEAKIKPLHLSVFDEEDLNNRKRRDKLYDRIGLINYKGFKYLSELTPHCETRGFKIITSCKYIDQVLNERDLLRTANAILENQKTRLEDKNKAIIEKYTKIIYNPFRLLLYWGSGILYNLSYTITWLTNKIIDMFEQKEPPKNQGE